MKNDGTACAVAPSFPLDLHRLVGRAVQDPAQSTEGAPGDVPTLLQSVQGPVVNAALNQMEKERLIGVLFDQINESDILEAELQDIFADREHITITMKDRTVFMLTFS